MRLAHEFLKVALGLLSDLLFANGLTNVFLDVGEALDSSGNAFVRTDYVPSLRTLDGTT